jgi:hypothetical protein
MPRRRTRFPLVLLLLFLAGSMAFAFRQGIIPHYLDPFPALDLTQPNAWFIDWRLAAIRNRPELCRRVISASQIEAQPIPDNPHVKGCGWVNGVRISAAGGARAGFDKATCEVAAALALWMEHDVQPVAQEMFGQRVASIQSFGSYSCRNIIGNPLWKDLRSEHSKANALDIGSFTLADKRRISVLQDWRGAGAEARFLRAIHQRACRYFRVVLGPEYNAAHRDHFHFDRGPFLRCK